MRDEAKAVVRSEAERRVRMHAKHSSSRPLSEDYEYIGLLGEVSFSQITGFAADLETKPGGDKGIDGALFFRMTYDVKTARKPYNLIHEEGADSWADIYILAKYCDQTDSIKFIGWEWGSVLASAPVRDFGYGIMNHYIPAEKLRDMKLLTDRVMKIR